MENSQIIGSVAQLFCSVISEAGIQYPAIWCAGPSVRNAGQYRILFFARAPAADALSGLIRTEVPARVMFRT